MKRHNLHSHSTKCFKCEICPRSYTLMANLKKHVKTHDESSNVVQCNICDRELATNYLKQHMETVHCKKDNTVFECDICLRQYHSLKSYRIHVKEVHQLMTHQCFMCSQNYSRKRDLDKHIKNVHHKIEISE